MKTNFLIRAESNTRWTSNEAEVKAHPIFKTLKADITKGGGKASFKKGYFTMKSMWTSPNPLQRAGWKIDTFYPGSGNGSNVSVLSKGGAKVKLEFPGGMWYIYVEVK